MSLEVRRLYYLSYPLRCAPWNFNCTLQTVSYSSLISIDDWQSSRNFRSVSGRNEEFPFSLSLFLIPQITNTRSVSWYTMLFFPWHLLKIRSDVVGDSLVYRNSLSWHILAHGLACELVDCYHIRHMCLPMHSIPNSEHNKFVLFVSTNSWIDYLLVSVQGITAYS